MPSFRNEGALIKQEICRMKLADSARHFCFLVRAIHLRLDCPVYTHAAPCAARVMRDSQLLEAGHDLYKVDA